ncbi:MAG: GtrA family protein [Verrucomicrobia bacterium]|jgi:dolichol-phosphate mannosyltransferase|nr:GtrA family protein [Verrucomicrobiota bacterium]
MMTPRAIHDVSGTFVRFCFVGSGGLIVDMGILFLLAEPSMLGWPVVLSKVLAAETAMINNFVWNEVWTFRDRSRLGRSTRNRLVRLLKFNLICFGGLVVAVVTLKALITWFAFSLYVANFAAIVAATGWNFGMNYTFNWTRSNETRGSKA